MLTGLASALALAAPATAAPSSRVLVAEFENDVNPVTQEYLLDAIEQGEDGGYAAVVIEMDTPGGLGSSMRAIVKAILAAKVPVVVYVAPPGASADSAGAVIGMSADVLAMAPQTNIGSSTPISVGGEDISRDLRRKVVNDAAAYIGELAREHGRNVAVARGNGHEATHSAPARPSRRTSPTYRGRLPGPLPSDRRHDAGAEGLDDLYTAGHDDRAHRDVGVEADPRHPDRPEHHRADALGRADRDRRRALESGLIFPGTVGAISLIVGLYGLQVLPVSAAGLLLMILAAAFFIAEAFIVSHGALSVAGAVMFVIGALLLFDPAGEAYQVSLPVALTIAGTLMLLFGFALTKAAQARRMPASVGTHRLVGVPGEVRGEQLVFVDGELWQAQTADGSPARARQGRRRRVGRPGRPPTDRRIPGTRSRKDVIR